MITLQQYIATWMHWIITWFQSIWDRLFGQVLTLDSGLQVRRGRPIAQGGYSIVYRATDINNKQAPPYALKRIHCHDRETVQACQTEAKVHYELQQAYHPKAPKYTMPLYGMTIVEENEHQKYCYMLFPLLPHSLREEVNQRIFERKKHPHNSPTSSSSLSSSSMPPPWKDESVVLQIFQHICQGVLLMHQVGYSHRDIKLENVLCHGCSLADLTRPVLMDFGSAGPLTQYLKTRQMIMEIVEHASQHTTISYRPPELFPGELRVSDTVTASTTNDNEYECDVLDYTKVDVWSLGCVLFAILYGASPFESEFHPKTGELRIVDCNQLRVLGKVPKPPPNTPPSRWYSTEMTDLIDWILTIDRNQRPTLEQVLTRVELLLSQQQQEQPLHHIVSKAIQDSFF